MRRRTSIGIALLALSHLAFANVSSALAQAGSTGGTIGKQDKSISGNGETQSDSPNARKKRPLRPNEGTGSACGRISTDIAGTWNSSSPSSASENIRPMGCNFVATLNNALFHHAISGRYLGTSNFSLTIARTNQMTSCTTVMLGSMTVTSGTQMQWVITSTDGKCDLPATYTETRMWSR